MSTYLRPKRVSTHNSGNHNNKNGGINNSNDDDNDDDDGGGNDGLTTRTVSSGSSYSEPGLSRFDDPDEILDLSRLGDELCCAVQRDGKASVSIWLLRRHLFIHRRDPQAAVRDAPSLLARVGCRAERRATPDDMTVTQWLRRCCLEHLAHKFIAAG